MSATPPPWLRDPGKLTRSSAALLTSHDHRLPILCAVRYGDCSPAPAHAVLCHAPPREPQNVKFAKNVWSYFSSLLFCAGPCSHCTVLPTATPRPHHRTVERPR